MDIVIATNNPGKLREFQAILGQAGIRCLSMRDVGLSINPEETGSTFAENAMIKAKACFEALDGRYACMADDSGIECDALQGAPGVYSARNGGPGLTDRERVYYLLGQMSHVDEPDRGIQYACAIACLLPDGRSITTEGYCRGTMLRELRGENGFGHDPAFYLPEYDMTFAELPSELKNQISHRSQALRACLEKL